MTHVASQYQEEIPAVHPVVRRFDIEVGHCSRCQRRVQGRHALQTSDALGAAGAQLGPGVVALVVELHTEMGVPLAKVSAVARKSVILDGTSTTTCRGCMSEHRRQEPIWTSVRGAGVKAVSPAERGRSEATRLDVGEHTRTLLA